MNADITNRESFRDLFEKYYDPLCNFCYSFLQDREVSEDIVQGIFIYLWENRDELEINISIVSYLFQSVKNRAIDHVRKLRTETAFKEKVKAVSQEESHADLDSSIRDHIIRDKIFRAMNSLKPKARKIFTMSKFEGLTYEEISQHLNIPKRTVENNMAVALRRLKMILEKDEELKSLLFKDR